MSTRIVKYAKSDQVAKLIIASGNVAWSEASSFTFTSGWKSPVYVNMRGVLAAPHFRRELIGHACTFLRSTLDLEEIDVIAGGETAGIPYAALIADGLEKEFSYVRKAQKGFGLERLIEGADVRNKKVLLVEDLTTDGRSKLSFADSIRRAGGEISDIFSCFYYGLRDVTVELLGPARLSLGVLCEWSDILDCPESASILSIDQKKSLLQFLADPPRWTSENRDIRSGTSA